MQNYFFCTFFKRSPKNHRKHPRPRFWPFGFFVFPKQVVALRNFGLGKTPLPPENRCEWKHMGVESKIRVENHPNHPLKNRVFHEINHPFWGTPIFGNTHMMMIILTSPSPERQKHIRKVCMLVELMLLFNHHHHRRRHHHHRRRRRRHHHHHHHHHGYYINCSSQFC